MKNYRVEKGGAGRAKHAVSFESALIICPVSNLVLLLLLVPDLSIYNIFA